MLMRLARVPDDAGGDSERMPPRSCVRMLPTLQPSARQMTSGLTVSAGENRLLLFLRQLRALSCLQLVHPVLMRFPMGNLVRVAAVRRVRRIRGLRGVKVLTVTLRLAPRVQQWHTLSKVLLPASRTLTRGPS